MAKDDMIELEGVVVESLPNTTFHVDIGTNGSRHHFGAYLRQAQNEFYPNPAGRQSNGADVSVRFDPRQNYLAFQVSINDRVKDSLKGLAL